MEGHRHKIKKYSTTKNIIHTIDKTVWERGTALSPPPPPHDRHKSRCRRRRRRRPRLRHLLRVAQLVTGNGRRWRRRRLRRHRRRRKAQQAMRGTCRSTSMTWCARTQTPTVCRQPVDTPAFAPWRYSILCQTIVPSSTNEQDIRN